MSKPTVHAFYHEGTSTLTYVVVDPDTNKAMIIDPVMDFDFASARTGSTHNDEVAAFCEKNKLDVLYICESHVHADHMTGGAGLRERFPDAKTGIGEHVTTVQGTFKKVFNLKEEFDEDGYTQFDILFKDGQTFELGNLEGRIMHTPGHTPACICYVIGDAVFTGDTVFMPDFGTARCDFPGGSSEDLYASIKKLYSLPDETRVFVGHDYMPGGRELKYETTIGEEKAKNKQLTADTPKDQFVQWRSERDSSLGMPKLIIPSLQVNLRNGDMPPAEDNGTVYLKIPINVLGPDPHA